MALYLWYFLNIIVPVEELPDETFDHCINMTLDLSFNNLKYIREVMEDVKKSHSTFSGHNPYQGGFCYSKNELLKYILTIINFLVFLSFSTILHITAVFRIRIRIRIIGQDPYQQTWIRMRVAKINPDKTRIKINQNCMNIIFLRNPFFV